MLLLGLMKMARCTRSGVRVVSGMDLMTFPTVRMMDYPQVATQVILGLYLYRRGLDRRKNFKDASQIVCTTYLHHLRRAHQKSLE
jgi:hypothetical protein